MLRRTISRPDRLVIVESPNKTAKITQILQGSVKDWTFGDKRLANAASPLGLNVKEGVAVMATIGHFMDTKDLIITRSDLIIPTTASPSSTTADTAKATKGKRASGKKSSSAASSALLDLPPMPLGAPLLSFKPDIKLRSDNTSMEAIVRYIQSNRNLTEVVLASDPDREGELIAVHALRYLMKKAGVGKANPNANGGKPLLYSRAYIQSITEEGILKAMRERQLQYCDFALAESASARHSMDRLFGWIGSSLMRRIDRSFVSIGRVQTPALILIREQEQKIQTAQEAHKASFIIQGKFNIFADVNNSGDAEASSASSAAEEPIYSRQVNFQIEGGVNSNGATAGGLAEAATATATATTAAAGSNTASSSSSQFTTKEEAEKWLLSAFGGLKKEGDTEQQQQQQEDKAAPKLKLSIIKPPTITTNKQKPPLPHTMQSLLTAANNQLKISSEDVTKCLQELFQAGLITYPRTDSTRIDDSFITESIQPHIEKQFGKDSFVNNQQVALDEENAKKEKEKEKEGVDGKVSKKKENSKKGKKEKEGNVEDAHEALRPTSLDRNPTDPAVLALFGIGNATPIAMEKKVDVVTTLGGIPPPPTSSYTSNNYSRNNLANCKSAFPVYRLIYQATLAAFMGPAETETTTVVVGVRPDAKEATAAKKDAKNSASSSSSSSPSASSSPMLVAKLTAARLTTPGWRATKVAASSSASSASSSASAAAAEDEAEAEGAAAEGSSDAILDESSSSSKAVSAFDLINNLPKYLGEEEGGAAADKNASSSKAKKGAAAKQSSSPPASSSPASSSPASLDGLSLRVAVADLKVAEKPLVLPKPFTEGTLIQTLKDYGVGRPSTYPVILKTLFDRKYVTRDGSQRLHTTATGQGVVRAARNAFPTLVDVNFTASFERELNMISKFRVGEKAEEGEGEERGGDAAGSDAPTTTKKKGGANAHLTKLADPTNPDLGEGANPLTCYTLSRLMYSLTSMVDDAIMRHMLLQEFKLADMRTIVNKSKELSTAATTSSTASNTSTPSSSSSTTTAAATTAAMGLPPPTSPALAAYSATSLFERDAGFDARRCQIAWRLPKIDIPLLLNTIANGHFKVFNNSNNAANGSSSGSSNTSYNRGAAVALKTAATPASASAAGGSSSSSTTASVLSTSSAVPREVPETVTQLTLNVFTSQYLSRHLGMASGFGTQLHTLGMDEVTSKKLFQCAGDRERLFAVPPKPSQQGAASSSLPPVNKSPITSSSSPTVATTTTTNNNTTTTSSNNTVTPSSNTSGTVSPSSADTEKKQKKGRGAAKKKEALPSPSAPPSPTPTPKPTPTPVVSTPSPTPSPSAAPTEPKKVFDPLAFFKGGGSAVRR